MLVFKKVRDLIARKRSVTTGGRGSTPEIVVEGLVLRAARAACMVPRSSVRKMNSGSEDADKEPRDEDAPDQPKGAEWNPAFANAMIGRFPSDDSRQEQKAAV
jgi:hypothetical protein